MMPRRTPACHQQTDRVCQVFLLARKGKILLCTTNRLVNLCGQWVESFARGHPNLWQHVEITCQLRGAGLPRQQGYNSAWGERGGNTYLGTCA